MSDENPEKKVVNIHKTGTLWRNLRLVQTTESTRERKWALCGEPESTANLPNVGGLQPIAWLYEMDFAQLVEDYNSQAPDDRDRYRKDDVTGRYRRRGPK